MKRFEIYKNKFQFGWDIYDMKITPIARVYQTPSNLEATTICQLLNDTENLDLIPNKINRYTPVCLRVDKYLYLIKNEKDANRAMFSHLSKMITDNRIENIKNAKSKEHKLYNKYVKLLNDDLKKGSLKNMYKLFDYFEKDNYSFEKFSNLIY